MIEEDSPNFDKFIKKLKIEVRKSNEDFSWDSMRPIILKKIDKLVKEYKEVEYNG